jgi:glycosyltransferase involved in cell wall biosynthesis
MWRIIRGGEFDILHLNTPRTLISAGLAAAIAKTPVVCSRRVDFPLRSRLSTLKYNGLVDLVLTISSSVERTLTAGGVKPTLIRVVYEGVDLNWLADQKVKGPAPDGPETVIGTVAALTREKGHRFLIDAARIVTAGRPGVRFVLVGEGSERPLLEQQANSFGISDNIIFTGFRSDSEALTQRFDIFCLPTLSEGLSSAIMVAMAQSVPVVATAVGGIPELVVDGKTGLLVPPADASALAAALEKLLNDQLLCQEMGKEGNRRIREQFTVTQKLDATEKVYLELLTTKSIR